MRPREATWQARRLRLPVRETPDSRANVAQICLARGSPEHPGRPELHHEGMAGMKTYTAHATKEERWWIVRVDGVGVTQAKNLREAHVMAADLIEAVTGLHASKFEVSLNTKLAPMLKREVEQARKAIDALEIQQVETARKSRDVARRLVEAGGLSGADAAVVLGVSPQRVSQLMRA